MIWMTRILAVLMSVLSGGAVLAVPPRPGDWHRAQPISMDSFEAPPPPFRPLSGGFRVLVILVEFADRPAVVTPEEIEGLFFGQSGYSMRDYFLEVSAGSFWLEGTVVGWVTAAGGHADYGADLPGGGDMAPLALAEEAVLLADPLVDFSVFDNNSDGEVDGLLIVHAGTGEETGDPDDIWSHSAWLDLAVDGVRVRHYGMGPELQRDGLVHTTTIGVYCHELAHNLGLPDLYDTTFQSAGIGPFGLMGTGAWGQRDVYPGDGPVHPCAWSLLFLGWASAEELLPGSYLARPGQVYRTIQNCADGEAFLLENRLQADFDSGLPGSGILIWHVDDRVDGNDEPNQLQVDLEEADGMQDLELSPQAKGSAQDFFFYGNQDEFGPATLPDSSSNDGQPTGILVSSIGSPGAEMPFSFGEVVPVPFSDAGGPYLVGEGELLTMDGSRSVGAETWEWDLDGDLDFNDASGPTPELDAHGLDGPAEFYAHLRVSGPGGPPDEDHALVEVANRPPEIIGFDVPATIVAGRPAFFGLEARDPCPADQLSWNFDLGGGELRQAGADGIEAVFSLSGTYQVRVDVSDDDGGSDFVEREVLVLPPGKEEGGCACGGSAEGSLLLFLLMGTAWWRRATS
jgi:M6 family metalloprotease-like protein